MEEKDTFVEDLMAAMVRILVRRPDGETLIRNALDDVLSVDPGLRHAVGSSLQPVGRPHLRLVRAAQPLPPQEN